MIVLYNNPRMYDGTVSGKNKREFVRGGGSGCRGHGGSDFGSAAAAREKKIWNFIKKQKNDKIAKNLEPIEKNH